MSAASSTALGLRMPRGAYRSGLVRVALILLVLAIFLLPLWRSR